MGQEAKIETGGPLGSILESFTHLQILPKVYPFYIASRIKQALFCPDPERIIVAVGKIETIGDCRHALEVKDFEGTSYRITVEVL